MTAAERRDATPDDPPALAQALRFLEMGLWPVVITGPADPHATAPGKQPIGLDWGKVRPTERSLRAKYAGHRDAGVGLKLGKAAGVVDVEVDDRATGEATLLEMMGGEVLVTLGWESRRGSHLLARWDDRLAAYGKTILKVGGVEVRAGSADDAGKQIQSVTPPTPNVDGTPRTWNGVETIAHLPDCFFAYLDRHLGPEPEEVRPRTIPLYTPPPGRWSPIDRARAYLAKIPPAVSHQGGHDRTFDAACNAGPGFGLSPEEFAPLLREWNETCQPPWSEKELRHKVADAYTKEQRRGWKLEERNGTQPHKGNFDGSEGFAGNSHGVNAQDDAPWKPPRLKEPTPAVLFPLDVLPIGLADLCRAGAVSFQCPPDYFAAAALALAGAAIGMSVNLSLKADFVVRPHLYMNIVGPPGSKKSPALYFMAAPLLEIDRELEEEYQREKLAHDADLAEHTAAKKRGDAGPPPVPPVRRQLTLDDVTREAVAQIHGENPRGLIVIRDELIGWVKAMNAYKQGGKGDDLQFWLSNNSGTPIKVNRKGGDRHPIIVGRPCAAVLGGLTPAMLPAVRSNSSADDGFVDRLMFAYPEPVEPGGWNEEIVPADLRDEWSAAIRRLWSRSMIVDMETGRHRPWLAHLAGDARPHWINWFDAHQAEIRHPDFPSSLRGPWVKLESYAARLVLILSLLHQAYDPESAGLPPVDADALSTWGATRLAEYFKAHYRRTLRELSPSPWCLPDDCQALIKWIRRSDRETFSERDAKNNFPGRFGRDIFAFTEAAEWLIRHDCLREVSQEAKVGRPHSGVFRVNPYLLDPQYGESDDLPEPLEL